MTTDTPTENRAPEFLLGQIAVLRAELAKFGPVDGNRDNTSLENWFPLTAEELARLRAELEQERKAREHWHDTALLYAKNSKYHEQRAEAAAASEAALREDAERYRWLKKNATHSVTLHFKDEDENERESCWEQIPEATDEAIDAARKEPDK